MCGIGLIVTGVPIAGRFSPDEVETSGFSCNGMLKGADEMGHPNFKELCSVLARRGPDHIGGQYLYLSPATQHLDKVEVRNSHGASETCDFERFSCVTRDCISNTKSVPVGIDAEIAVESGRCGFTAGGEDSSSRFQFIGSTLQLRGDHSVQQPIVDSVGNVLVYNGEIFGGLEVSPRENDTEVIMEALRDCCSCPCHGHQGPVPECECAEPSSTQPHQTVPQLLSRLRGPWALIYWQAVSRTLWFGRDVVGRRSLLIHKPTQEDPRLLLTSVAPELTRDEGTVASKASRKSHSDADILDDTQNPALHISHQSPLKEPGTSSTFWEELTCGIHSIVYQTGFGRNQQGVRAWARIHEWHDPLQKKLLAWERNYVRPSQEQEAYVQTGSESGAAAVRVLEALCEAVRRRTENIRTTISSQELGSKAPCTMSSARSRHCTPIAVLFSGGVDSMILAAIAHQFVDPDACIDLLNISFEGDLAPDRITAVSGISELKGVFPLRRWRLIKIDAKLSEVQAYRGHLVSLICPSNTYMDINIGTALWLAASGRGYVHPSSSQESLVKGSMESKPVQSEARVLLVGSGADEQCGGYGRHRTKFRHGGWETLDAEMRLDFSRIWKRNLGRDDRCLSDHGKEARFPFLDEDVVATLLGLPLWDVVNMEEPAGCGDKKILRQNASFCAEAPEWATSSEVTYKCHSIGGVGCIIADEDIIFYNPVARLLGLKSTSSLPKRAIQFGSRIARESNRKDFGSNRAANLANAGTVILRT